jgi:hypothetical protein
MRPIHSNLVHLHYQGDTVRLSDGTSGVIEDLGWVSHSSYRIVP